jgi:hypothetical protein
VQSLEKAGICRKINKPVPLDLNLNNKYEFYFRLKASHRIKNLSIADFS